LWLSRKLVPTGRRPSGGVTILDFEQDPIAFFPNPIDVVQFYIPREALEEFAYENRVPAVNSLSWPHCEMDVTLRHFGVTVLSAVQRNRPAPKIFLDHIGYAILGHATYAYGGAASTPGSTGDTLLPGKCDERKNFWAQICTVMSL
jgi:AraC family transcriptional regulator